MSDWGDQNSIENQLIYKVSALESTIKEGMERIHEKIDTLQSYISRKHDEIIKDFSKLEERVEKQQEEINKLKQWKAIVVTRATMITAGMAIFWTIFGGAINTLMKGLVD